MTEDNIIQIRLYNQQITGNKTKTVKELVAHMGAMQAQDFSMVKWAVGLRHKGSSERLVENAMGRGEILRTHVMRPTWHLVSSGDIYWMLKLTAPHIQASLKSRHRELEITDSVLKVSNSVIVKALQGGNHLTREELIRIFQKAGISTDGNRASHLLLYAELECIICSGITKDNKPTYALFEERVPKSDTIPRAEALAKLALRYFSSHGPATLQDFTWWSGLPVKDARKALEMINSDLISETSGREVYWMTDTFHGKGAGKNFVRFLPAYDEFLISYKDRSASLSGPISRSVVSVNGIFRPVILVNGQVAGIWKRAVKNRQITIVAELFVNPDKNILAQLEKSVTTYASFTGVAIKQIQIYHGDTSHNLQ